MGIISLLSLAFFSQLFNPGATGYTFLKLGVGVRPVAMGNAFTALSDDGNAIFWNPSGLGFLKSYYVTGMAMRHLVYFGYYNLSSVIPLGKYGSIGIGASYLTGTDIEYSEWSEAGNEFRNYDMLLNIGYGKSFGKRQFVSFGGAVKIVRSRLYTYTAHGVLADIGVIINPFKYIYLGTVLRNLGTPRKFIEKWEWPPVNFRQGIAFKFPFWDNQFAISMDYSIYPDIDPTVSIGGEVRIRAPGFMEQLSGEKISGFAVMVGYQTGYQLGTWSGLSLGFSLEIILAEGFYLDIGALLLSYGYLGSSERIALGLNYVPKKERRKK